MGETKSLRRCRIYTSNVSYNVGKVRLQDRGESASARARVCIDEVLLAVAR